MEWTWYPEIKEWLDKRLKPTQYSVYQLSPDFVSIKFKVDDVPEEIIEEFKDFVRKNFKVQEIKDVFTIGNHYVDIIMKRERFTEPPLPFNIDIERVLLPKGFKPKNIHVSEIKSRFKKYTIYSVYGGKYKTVDDEAYIKIGRKYLYYAIKFTEEWYLCYKIPLEKVLVS